MGLLYRFDQDNGRRFTAGAVSPWEYDREAGVTVTILMEADSAEEANGRVEERLRVDFGPQTSESGRVFHRWFEAHDDSLGFDTERDALGASDVYEFFDPRTLDPVLHGWPVFVHYEDGRYEPWHFRGDMHGWCAGNWDMKEPSSKR